MKNLIFLFVLFIAISCKKEATAHSEAKVVSLELPENEGVYKADAAVAVDSAAAAVEEPGATEPAEAITQKIIKNANLRFESSSLPETYATILTASKKYKATIQNDSEGKNYSSIYRNITVRIPAENFDNFINEISKGITYFDQKDISSQDVTEEYIDVASRIKTKKALEERYLNLLSKANKVSEMLEVESQLSAIREEIEAKEGRLKYLQNRVALSTINIEFYKPLAQESGATVSYGTKIWNAIKSGFNSISNFFIGLLEIWPIILILVALFYFIRKRIKKRGGFFNKKRKEIDNENI
jgi:hypothetical protein